MNFKLALVLSLVLLANVLADHDADDHDHDHVAIQIPWAQPDGSAVDLFLAAAEDLGSFYCDNTPAKQCEFVFTTDDEASHEIKWDIVPYMEGETECVKIVKACGYGAGESLGAKAERVWDAPFGDGSLALYMDMVPGPNKCWQIEEQEDGSSKIKKVLGIGAGMYLRAPPVTFKEESVSKARRFVTVSSTDSDNLWTVRDL